MSTDVVALQLRETGAAESGRKTIPFDYTVHFPVDDDRERNARPRTLRKDIRLSALVQISIEAPFVATGIGYGFVLPVNRIEFGVPPAPPAASGPILLAAAVRPPDVLETAFNALDAKLAATPALGGITLEALLANGFTLNPKYAAQLLPKPGGKRGFDWSVLGTRAPADLFFALAPAPETLQFLYAIHDEGSGRAFQSDLVLSTAGLGGPDGKRPFRHLATPVQFAPRSTIRIDVVPLQDVVGELHFSLHGYKVLGSPGTPTDIAHVARRLRRRVRG